MKKHETNFKSEGQKGIRISMIAGVIIALGMFQASYDAFNGDDNSSGWILLLIGIAALYFGFTLGANMITGACPYCAHTIMTYKNQLNTKCKACRKRIVIKDSKFIGVD